MPDSDAMKDIYAKLDSIDHKLEEARGERKNSQLLVTLMTAIVTSAVGFAAWYAQSHVQQRLDDNAKKLETILALKQEVYSRELDRYESVHEQMAALFDALSQVQVDPTQKKTADEAINKLYVTYTTDSLYLSNDVVAQLKKLVSASGNLPSLNSSGTANAPASLTGIEDVQAQITVIENQMKTDLDLTHLGQISQGKNKPAASTAN